MNRTEYDKLVALINHHMKLYYDNDEPEISDYEYDNLMLDLKAAEKEHPEWVTPDSPTQKIGATVKRESGVKVSHDVPMLSIEDVFTPGEVTAWVEKVHAIHPDCTFSVETKIDGASATLRYKKSEKDGKLHLVLCESRGDGETGEDVTANARMIPDALEVIDLPYDELQIRGEIYMTHSDFNRFNELQESLGKSLRQTPETLLQVH